MALSANNHKMHSLMRQLRMDAPVFDALQLERHIDAIVAQAGRYLEAGAPLRERLLQRSRELGAEVGHNMGFVRRLAGSPS